MPQTTSFAQGQRVNVLVEGKYWRQGTVQGAVTAEDAAQSYSSYSAADVGKNDVLLDSGFQARRTTYYRVAAGGDEIRELTREHDGKFQQLVSDLNGLHAKYGDEFVRAATEIVLGLDPACRAGSHDWGAEHGGYGGANERKDCQRPGCDAYVID